MDKEKARIARIVKSSWTEKNGRTGYCFRVYYKGNRVRLFSMHDNLPGPVWQFLVADNTECVTDYMPGNEWARAYKRETFTLI